MEEKKRILKKINSECFGGSENQLRLLLKNLPDENFKNINLILNNTNPSLIEKDQLDGDLRYNNDFRQTYTDIVEDWFNIDAPEIVNGKFNKFGFINQ